MSVKQCSTVITIEHTSVGFAHARPNQPLQTINTKEPYGFLSQQKMKVYTVTLHAKECSKNTVYSSLPNVLYSTYSFSFGVRLWNMKYHQNRLVLLGMWKDTEICIRALKFE